MPKGASIDGFSSATPLMRRNNAYTVRPHAAAEKGFNIYADQCK